MSFEPIHFETSNRLGDGTHRLRPIAWVAHFASIADKQPEATLTELAKNFFEKRESKFHRTGPTTGKRVKAKFGRSDSLCAC